jgi:hypothetical protein
MNERAKARPLYRRHCVTPTKLAGRARVGGLKSRRAWKLAAGSGAASLHGPRSAQPKEVANYLRSQRVRRRKGALYARPESPAATTEKPLLGLLAS